MTNHDHKKQILLKTYNQMYENIHQYFHGHCFGVNYFLNAIVKVGDSAMITDWLRLPTWETFTILHYISVLSNVRNGKISYIKVN